jgi:hypothetical protein
MSGAHRVTAQPRERPDCALTTNITQRGIKMVCVLVWLEEDMLLCESAKSGSPGWICRRSYYHPAPGQTMGHSKPERGYCQPVKPIHLKIGSATSLSYMFSRLEVDVMSNEAPPFRADLGISPNRGRSPSDGAIGVWAYE